MKQIQKDTNVNMQDTQTKRYKKQIQNDTRNRYKNIQGIDTKRYKKQIQKDTRHRHMKLQKIHIQKDTR